MEYVNFMKNAGYNLTFFPKLQTDGVSINYYSCKFSKDAGKLNIQLSP